MSFPYQVSVQNNTGSDIYYVSIIHYCDDTTSGAVFPSIASGLTQPVSSVTTYATHKDYWAGQFAMGGEIYQFNCYCSPDSGDTSCTVILGSDSYTIQYYSGGSATDSCLDKSYDFTTN